MATYNVGEFKDGDWKGFKFNVVSYESAAEAVESLGESNVLALLNQQVASRIRAKVKNSLPKQLSGDDLITQQSRLQERHPDGVLFSQEEAGKWKPDARDLTPTALFKLAQSAFKAGDQDKGTELLRQMQSMMAGE
jgi:hypothetical protein|tara:strand:- start:3457 stop:3864 length:408 start_codon:yes stop_codon:yes gene_type:complete